jgi:flavin reductase (DIM6/NTAB) family NADH-FMN oxidoreductase RutF
LKKEWKASNAMYPLPIILISTTDRTGRDNIMTAAWTTNVSKNNNCVAVSIGGDKRSLRNIKETEDFVINIPSGKLLKEVDFCGESTGDKIDKFSFLALNRADARMVRSKIITECPINLECRLKEIIMIDSASLVIGQIVNIHMDEEIMEKDQIDYKKLDPVLYAQKTYFSLGHKLDKRGFSKK